MSIGATERINSPILAETNEQTAARCQDEILRLKAIYIAAKNAFEDSRRADVSLDVQRRLFRELHETATAAFNSVEKCIVQSDLLGANRGDLWAYDLARTAVNTIGHIAYRYQRLWENADRLGLARPTPDSSSFFAMQSSAKIYLPDEAAKLQQQFEQIGLPVGGFKKPTPMNTRYKQWERIVMVVTAIAFVLIMLLIGIFVDKLNNFNIFLFRTVLALVGGAFAGIFIPGMLKIQHEGARFGITAAGAAAFFVIIFFFNPPALVKQSVETVPSSATSTPSPAP